MQKHYLNIILGLFNWFYVTTSIYQNYSKTTSWYDHGFLYIIIIIIF